MKRFIALAALLLVAGCGALPKPVEPPTPTPPPTQPPTQVTPPITQLQMIVAKVGWALGGDALLSSSDGGAHWTAVSPKEVALPANSGADFTTFYFRDGRTGWVATGKGGAATTILRTTNGGTSWDRITGPNAARVALSFPDAQHGWMLAGQGVAMGAEADELYYTTNGGTDWTLVAKTMDPPRADQNSLPFQGVKTGITFRNASTGWVTGESRLPDQVWLYQTNDGGHTWRQQGISVPDAFKAHQIRTSPPVFFSDKDGLLPVTFTPGYETIFFRTHDGGATWTAGAPVKSVLSPEGNLVADFADLSHGWATDGVHLYTTSDGGQTWSTQTPGASLAGVKQLDFVTDRVGWAVLSRGEVTVLQTTDGGSTWRPLAP